MLRCRASKWGAFPSSSTHQGAAQHSSGGSAPHQHPPGWAAAPADVPVCQPRGNGGGGPAGSWGSRPGDRPGGGSSWGSRPPGLSAPAAGAAAPAASEGGGAWHVHPAAPSMHAQPLVPPVAAPWQAPPPGMQQAAAAGFGPAWDVLAVDHPSMVRAGSNSPPPAPGAQQEQPPPAAAPARHPIGERCWYHAFTLLARTGRYPGRYQAGRAEACFCCRWAAVIVPCRCSRFAVHPLGIRSAQQQASHLPGPLRPPQHGMPSGSGGMRQARAQAPPPPPPGVQRSEAGSMGGGALASGAGGGAVCDEPDSWHAGPTAAELFHFVAQHGMHSAPLDAVVRAWHDDRHAGGGSQQARLAQRQRRHHAQHPAAQPRRQQWQEQQHQWQQQEQQQPSLQQQQQQLASQQQQAYQAAPGSGTALQRPPVQQQQQQAAQQGWQESVPFPAPPSAQPAAGWEQVPAAAAPAPKLRQAVLVSAGKFVAPEPELPGKAWPGPRGLAAWPSSFLYARHYARHIQWAWDAHAAAHMPASAPCCMLNTCWLVVCGAFAWMQRHQPGRRLPALFSPPTKQASSPRRKARRCRPRQAACLVRRQRQPQQGRQAATAPISRTERRRGRRGWQPSGSARRPPLPYHQGGRRRPAAAVLQLLARRCWQGSFWRLGPGRAWWTAHPHWASPALRATCRRRPPAGLGAELAVLSWRLRALPTRLCCAAFAQEPAAALAALCAMLPLSPPFWPAASGCCLSTAAAASSTAPSSL